jgi:hypothetical protein
MEAKRVRFSEMVEVLGYADPAYDRTPVVKQTQCTAPVVWNRDAHECQRSTGQAQYERYQEGSWAEMFLSMDTFVFTH